MLAILGEKTMKLNKKKWFSNELIYYYIIAEYKGKQYRLFSYEDGNLFVSHLSPETPKDVVCAQDYLADFSNFDRFFLCRSLKDGRVKILVGYETYKERERKLRRLLGL